VAIFGSGILLLLTKKKIKPMQNYKNHRRLYPFHHFIITPLSIVFLIWSFSKLGDAINSGGSLSDSIYFLIAATMFVFLPLLARIYALKNQNRIIRLEMRQRYFEMTGKSFKEKESQLRLSQIIALRFAGDAELLPLMERAIKEKMKANDIKKAITNWQEDRHRV
jgi:hypothetical protein